MKILAVTDKVVKSIYSAHIRKRFGDVDLVISCGDLPYSYLEFIVSMLNVPCFFVHGNHDRPQFGCDGQARCHPGGWINLDGRTVRAKGLTLAGFEGAVRYKPRGDYQYTEAEMSYKVWRMIPSFLINRLRYGRYLDILVTHAPPWGIHSGKDRAHQGFKAFLGLMKHFRPRYLLHGHKHVYVPQKVETSYQETEVINVYPYRVIEWDEEGIGSRPELS